MNALFEVLYENDGPTKDGLIFASEDPTAPTEAEARKVAEALWSILGFSVLSVRRVESFEDPQARPVVINL